MILLILLIVSIITNVYLWKKWKENEALFELSKGYETSLGEGIHADLIIKVARATDPKITTSNGKNYAVTAKMQGVNVKLNKDGSIAKKRGPKPKAK